MRHFRTTPVLGLLLGTGLLAACGGTDTEPDDAPATAQAAAAESVTLTDAWVRATDEDMTAIFGVLENGADAEARIVAADSDLSMVELHEVVESDGAMVMQEIPDGFTVPAGGEHELTPGGDHLMLMGLSDPIVAGDEVTVTLRFEDGSELEVTAVAKDFEGGDEDYQPHDMDGM